MHEALLPYQGQVNCGQVLLQACITVKGKIVHLRQHSTSLCFLDLVDSGGKVEQSVQVCLTRKHLRDESTPMKANDDEHGYRQAFTAELCGRGVYPGSQLCGSRHWSGSQKGIMFVVKGTQATLGISAPTLILHSPISLGTKLFCLVEVVQSEEIALNIIDHLHSLEYEHACL